MREETKNNGFGVTERDLRDVDWQAVLDAAPLRECHSIYEVLVTKAKAAESTGNLTQTRVFQLLAAVASLWINLDRSDDPFAPMLVDYASAQRTTAAGDFSVDDFKSLLNVLNEIRNPEFRARVGDLLWVGQKNYKAALVAIDAYIESSARLEDAENWVPFVERLHRALQIGAKLGWNKAPHQKGIIAIEAAITKYSGSDKEFLSARLMELLYQDKVGNEDAYSALAEKLAKQAESQSLWDLAHGYWQCKAAWDSRRGKDDDLRASKLKIAEMLIRRAESFISAKTPSFMAAAHWMAQAVEALRQAKAEPSEIEKTHQTLLEYQRRSMSEMETVAIDIDNIPGLRDKAEAAAKEAENLVSGHSFQNAILRLVNITLPSRPDELRKRVESASKRVISQLFGACVVRSGGQTSDTRPPMATEDPQRKEEAVVKEMYNIARTVDWPFRAQNFIDPARCKIIEEHPARLQDFRFLVQDNPFVPSGREGLFLRGLHAGLHGDLVLAMHVLIPQVENSIRTVFTLTNVITSKLDSDKTQDERDLGWLLTHPSMGKTFTPGMAFDLRGLLVERFGLNLRNDLAHGLLDEAQMSTYGPLYVWWLVLRLCCIPIANGLYGEQGGIGVSDEVAMGTAKL